MIGELCIVTCISKVLPTRGRMKMMEQRLPIGDVLDDRNQGNPSKSSDGGMFNFYSGKVVISVGNSLTGKMPVGNWEK